MIRPFSHSDVTRCREIIRSCFEKSVSLDERAKRFVIERFTEQGYLESKSEEYPFFVYEEDVILAMGAVMDNVIKKLYVDPNVQGKGIGTKLLSHLETEAMSKGWHEFVLYSFESSSGFYERKGYVIVGTKTYGEGEIVVPTLEMRKGGLC